MGIIMGIISFFFGFVINLLDSAVTGFFDVFSFSMSAFYAIFPVAESINYVFTAMGLAFLMVGLIWNGIKGLGVIIGAEVENPIYIIGKVALAWFAVVNSTEILNIIINFFQDILLAIKDTAGNTYDMTSMMTNLASSALMAADPTGLLGIVYLITVLVLGFKFIKFLVEIIERYIVFCFICFISPVFISTAAFKTTKPIADTWLRAFMGQSILLILNMWCSRLFMSFCFRLNNSFIAITTSDGDTIPAFIVFFCGLAFLNFSTRIDTFLRILGLSTAHTGTTMVGGLGFALRQAASSMALQKIKSSSLGNIFSKVGSNSGSGASSPSSAGSINGGVPAASGGAGSITGTDNSINSATGSNTSTGSSEQPRTDGIPAQTPQQGANAQTGTNIQPAAYRPPPGDGLRGKSRIAAAEGALQSLYGKQGNPDSRNGFGQTNALSGMKDKETYVKGGMSASMGRQQQIADENLGKTSVGGPMKQDQITADAVRAAATSAETYPDSEKPIASFENAEAAAVMNGVMAFGNDNVTGFKYSQDSDGNNYVSGMQYANGDSVSFDQVEGGIASGEYYDNASGERTGFTMVHDNAVKSMEEGLSNSTGVKFDTGSSIGRIGDGSGTSGYHVVPKNPNHADSLIPFIQNSNAPSKRINVFNENFLDMQQRMARGSVPRMNNRRNDRHP